MDDGRVRVWPLDLSVWLWFTQLVVAGVASFVVLARRWSVPHCDLRCDFDQLEAAGDVFLVIAWGALVVSATALVLLWVLRPSGSRYRRADWLLPLGGIILTLGAAIIAYQVSNTALLFN